MMMMMNEEQEEQEVSQSQSLHIKPPPQQHSDIDDSLAPTVNNNCNTTNSVSSLPIKVKPSNTCFICNTPKDVSTNHNSHPDDNPISSSTILTKLFKLKNTWRGSANINLINESPYCSSCSSILLKLQDVYNQLDVLNQVIRDSKEDIEQKLLASYKVNKSQIVEEHDKDEICILKQRIQLQKQIVQLSLNLNEPSSSALKDKNKESAKVEQVQIKIEPSSVVYGHESNDNDDDESFDEGNVDFSMTTMMDYDNDDDDDDYYLMHDDVDDTDVYYESILANQPIVALSRLTSLEKYIKRLNAKPGPSCSKSRKSSKSMKTGLMVAEKKGVMQVQHDEDLDLGSGTARTRRNNARTNYTEFPDYEDDENDDADDDVEFLVDVDMMSDDDELEPEPDDDNPSDEDFQPEEIDIDNEEEELELVIPKLQKPLFVKHKLQSHHRTNRKHSSRSGYIRPKTRYANPAFKCHVCDKQLYSTSKLAAHLRTHLKSRNNADGVFTDNDNGTGAEGSSLKKTHRGKLMACMICGKPCLNQKEAFAHEETHKGTWTSSDVGGSKKKKKGDGGADGVIIINPPTTPKSYKCLQENCTKTYDSRKGLNSHIQKYHPHLTTPRIPKLVRASSSSNLIVPTPPDGGDGHEAPQTGTSISSADVVSIPPPFKAFSCPICSKSFYESHDLKEHSQIHKPDSARRYICTTCGKGFHKPGVIRMHELKHRMYDSLPSDIDQLLMVPGAKSQSTECKLCHEQIPNTQLQLHVRSHFGQKVFTCHVCGRQFPENKNLQYHMRIHTGEKPHECNVCQMKFRTSTNLRRHLKTHSTLKPFVCDFCGKSFRQIQNLKQHTYVHTDEAPFRCNICGRRYPEARLLSDHLMLDHTEEQREKKGQKTIVGPNRRRHGKNDTSGSGVPIQIPLLNKYDMDNTSSASASSSTMYLETQTHGHGIPMLLHQSGPSHGHGSAADPLYLTRM